MSPPAYVIVAMKINDPERYKAYMAAAQEVVRAHGGEYLVRGGQQQTLEGDWHPQRLAMLRFPSLQQARAFYDSPAYRDARGLRAGLTDYFNLVVVEGVAAPV